MGSKLERGTAIMKMVVSEPNSSAEMGGRYTCSFSCASKPGVKPATNNVGKVLQRNARKL